MKRQSTQLIRCIRDLVGTSTVRPWLESAAESSRRNPPSGEIETEPDGIRWRKAVVIAIQLCENCGFIRIHTLKAISTISTGLTAYGFSRL